MLSSSLSLSLSLSLPPGRRDVRLAYVVICEVVAGANVTGIDAFEDTDTDVVVANELDEATCNVVEGTLVEEVVMLVVDA